ncbi:hypothetical protein BJ546DRAFT_1057271 [Cryomyces antarcticus]|uniref:Uncharacterized protein n=1 Tax=Cryomyces antarcticus TaxID=329879 RepID=A0ABR0LP77_9PEZI|nr:hypothetical protein LTR16_002967 [Cryomyces antarcticus]
MSRIKMETPQKQALMKATDTQVPKLSKPCHHYLEFLDQLSSVTVAPTVLLHVKVYNLAEKYNVWGLKAAAVVQFEKQLTVHWSDAEFFPALYVAYQNTPENEKFLRHAAADALNAHPELPREPEVQAAMYEVNGWSYEPLKRSMKKVKDLKEELGY